MREKVKKIKKKVEEKIQNLPNFLTLSRVIITVIILYLAIAGFTVKAIIIFFLIGMFTDALDGFIARKYKLKTQFGKRFDIVADKTLIFGTFAAILIYNAGGAMLTRYGLLMVFLLLPRIIL